MINEEMPVKVLVVISHLAVGGAESIAITLAEGASTRAHFTFFSVMHAGRDLNVAADMIERLAKLGSPSYVGTTMPFKRGGILLAAWRLRRLILKLQPDVVHVHTEVPELTLAVALLGFPAWRSRRVLRTVHNAVLWSNWAPVGRWVTRRLGLASAAGVSNAALDADARLRTEAGLAPAPVNRRELIYNGVKVPRRRRACFSSGTRELPMKLLFAGRFELQKGADMLPEILRRASVVVPGRAEVTLIGGGGLRMGVKADLEESDLPWRLTFLDAVPNLNEQIADYDLYLMPSRFEGLGLVAIEAGLSRVPVLAFSAIGLDEVVSGSDPLSIPQGDIAGFVSRLVDFIEQPRDYIDHARKRSEKLERQFDLNNMIERYLKLYKSLLAESQ